MSERQVALRLTALWLLLVLVSLFSRSYIPIDETRYVTVAWNMWLRGDFLVPFLNGVAYSHKPPLLFWLINAGWGVFGVNEWWPRLVPSLFALGSIFLTVRLARQLWPAQSSPALLAPAILFGCLLWTVFTTATMFDMMVATFTLLGMSGVLSAWRGDAVKGWVMVGVAIGLGLLAKGPTILLQILPVAILAPWWGRGGQQPWGRWYAGMLAAITLGALIALAWAIPAGMRGGAEYHHAIFWGQTADRMVNSFAHRRLFWWYLPLLPVMLFPWLLWLPGWHALAGLRRGIPDVGVRFCLAWFLPVFIAFSFISGKQMHYLLPIFPPFALLLARLLDTAAIPKRSDVALPALVIFLVGVSLLVLPLVVPQHAIFHLPVSMSPVSGLALIAISVAMAAAKIVDVQHEVWKMAVLSVTAVAIFVMSVVQYADLAYDVRPISAKIKALQDAGVPLAHAGKYHGQYQFLGRLTQTPEIVTQAELTNWFMVHPDGKAIVYFDTRLSWGNLRPDYTQPYLGDSVAIVGREAWQAHGSRNSGGSDSGED